MISIRFFHLAKATIYSLLVSIILYSCNAGTSGKNGTAKNKDSAATQVAIKPTPSAHILASNIAPHFFSGHTQKDTFKLILMGDSLYNATAIFSISCKGERIYADTFNGFDLYNKNDVIGSAIANIDDSIKNRVKIFFENKAFDNTVTDMSDAGEGNCDTAFMKEIRTDETIIGFRYSIGEEDDQCIAYSKIQHKVVVYWSCC